MDLGSNIKKYRKEAGLTQKELASILDVAVGTIQQYESNKRQPRIEQLQRIADALGVPINIFIDGYLEVCLPQIAENLVSIENEIITNTTKDLENATKQLIELGADLIRDKAIENFDGLTPEGQVKVYNYTEDMISNPKYRKHT